MYINDISILYYFLVGVAGMLIGQFLDWSIIRLRDNLMDDFHIADAIYQEINKGVYIPSGGL